MESVFKAPIGVMPLSLLVSKLTCGMVSLSFVRGGSVRRCLATGVLRALLLPGYGVIVFDRVTAEHECPGSLQPANYSPSVGYMAIVRAAVHKILGTWWPWLRSTTAEGRA